MSVLEGIGLETAALEYACVQHSGQFRKALPGAVQIPYIAHPVAVATSLIRVGAPSEAIAAAYCHDVLEDCGVTLTELEAHIGEKAAAIVMEVTDSPGLHGAARKQAQIDRVPSMSFGAKIIKIADKTANLIDVVSNPPPWEKASKLGYAMTSMRLIVAIEKSPMCPAEKRIASQLLVRWGDAYKALVESLDAS